MKIVKCCLWSLAISALTSVTAYCQTASPDRALSADVTRLTGLMKVFVQTQARNDQFGYEFTRASKRLADERGPEIVHAVMYLSRKWRGEEDLVYVPLIEFLPRKATVKMFHQYEHSDREIVRTYASDFLAELEMYTPEEEEKNLEHRFPQWPHGNSFPK